MKRFAIFLAALSSCLLASCGEDEKDQGYSSRIEYIAIKANLNGLASDIDGDVDHQLQTISFDRYIADGTAVIFTFGSSGAVYYGGEVILTEKTRVEFREDKTMAVIAPNGSTVSYKIKIPARPDGEKDKSNQLTSFALRLTQNGSTANRAGVIDQQKRTITVDVAGTSWIDNIHEAAAVFSTTGASVEADGEVQTSGVTTNNFMADVVYTVTAENGDRRDYTVKVVSPQSTGLPVVRIDTEGGAPIASKTNYVNASVSIYDPADAHIKGAAAGVRGRGNSTWGYDKKPYRIKFDKKTSVFGLKKAKSWVLLANWQDPTYIMNTVAFEISRRIGLPFTPAPNHVELFVNGAYKGGYVLCEQIQAGEGRVEIDELADVLLELDSYFDDTYQFLSSRINMPVIIKSPEFEGVTAAERETAIAAIKADYNKMEQAVISLSGWRDYLDVASFIDYMIIFEVTRNPELEHPKSTFLYKRAGGKWMWGPVWDFDWAFGYSGGQNYWSSPQSHLYTGRNGSRAGAQFFNKLFQDAAFKKEYKARWNQIKPLIADIDVFVGEMGALLAESDVQNKKVWGYQYTKDYGGQISSMQSWLRQRIAYLDGVVAGF